MSKLFSRVNQNCGINGNYYIINYTYIERARKAGRFIFFNYQKENSMHPDL